MSSGGVAPGLHLALDQGPWDHESALVVENGNLDTGDVRGECRAMRGPDDVSANQRRISNHRRAERTHDSRQVPFKDAHRICSSVMEAV